LFEFVDNELILAVCACFTSILTDSQVIFVVSARIDAELQRFLSIQVKITMNHAVS